MKTKLFLHGHTDQSHSPPPPSSSWYSVLYCTKILQGSSLGTWWCWKKMYPYINLCIELYSWSNISLQVCEAAVRLAHRHAQQAESNPHACFLVGAVAVDPGMSRANHLSLLDDDDDNDGSSLLGQLPTGDSSPPDKNKAQILPPGPLHKLLPEKKNSGKIWKLR